MCSRRQHETWRQSAALTCKHGSRSASVVGTENQHRPTKRLTQLGKVTGLTAAAGRAQSLCTPTRSTISASRANGRAVMEDSMGQRGFRDGAGA